MKSQNLVTIVSIIFLFYNCNDGTSKVDPAAADTSKFSTSGDFGAGGKSTTLRIDTTLPPLESFRKIVRPSPNQTGNEFYTEKNYQGEKFVVNNTGNYKLDEGIIIKSMKLQPGVQVSFDFGSDCNSIESGRFRYFNNQMMDILANCGCDENFSKISEIYIRPEIGGEGLIYVWEKPYLLGEGQHVLPPPFKDKVELYKVKEFRFPTAASIQLPKGLLVNLYKDEHFKNLLQQINTSEGAIEKSYFFSQHFTYDEFKSFSIVRLK